MTRKIPLVVALVFIVAALDLVMLIDLQADVLLAQRRAEEGPPPKTDRFGDPLPVGAIARMGTARLGSDCRWIVDAAFCAGGKQLVSVGRDQKIRLWEVATGKELRQFPGASFIVSPDSKRLVYQGMNGANVSGYYQVIELATGKAVTTFPVGNPRVRAFSPNGKTLALAGFWDPDHETKVGLYRVTTGKAFAYLDAKRGGVAALAFSPDQRTLAAANADKTITLWDMPTDKKILDLTGHQGEVLALGFSADGAQLASVSRDQTARKWDAVKGVELRRFPVENGRRAFFSPGAKQLAVVGQLNTVVFYDVATGKKVDRWQGTTPLHMNGEDGFLTVAYSPDERMIALGGGERIDLRVAGNGAEVYAGHTNPVPAVEVSPDGLTVATSSSDGLRLWEAASGKQRCRIAGDGFGTQGFAFAADSRTITVLNGVVVLLCDAVTGKERRRFAVAGKTPEAPPRLADRPALLTAISADAGRVAVAVGGEIQLWDVGTGKIFRKIALPGEGRYAFQSIALSPDGRIVCSLHVRRTSADARGESYVTIKLWEVVTGKLIRELASGGPLVFSPDGKTVATVGNTVIQDVYNRHRQDSKVRLWDLTTGKELYQLDTAYPVAFSSDGEALASAGANGAIRFWRTATGKPDRQLQGPQRQVTAIAFGPDCSFVVSGGADSTAVVWQGPGLARQNEPPNGRLTPQELESLWSDLAADSPATGYRAIGGLLASPRQAVPLLRERLKPTPPLDPRRLAQLIADLGNEQFKVRQKASSELEKLGPLAAPALERLLVRHPSLEEKRRAELLLGILRERGCSPETLRLIRGCVVLESLNTLETRRMLESLARAEAEDEGTRDAQAARARLAKRPSAAP